MINIQFEKDALFHEQKKAKVLLEIQGQKPIEKIERSPLNICISIDISGSMQGRINSNTKQQKNNYNSSFFLRNINDENNIKEQPKSKIEQAKKVAQKAVDNLHEGDFISVVVFSESAEVIVDAIQINCENKEDIKSKINAIHTKGLTNINEGYLTAVTEVAKNIDSKRVNRVLLISDGITNCGEVITDNICNGVSRIKNKGVSVSTFGIGKDFNEELLIAISNVGDGNSYYIDKDDKLGDTFNIEFNDISNIVAINARLNFNLNEDVSIEKIFNEFEFKDRDLILPNIKLNSKIPLLISLKTNIKKNSKKYSLGNVLLSYKDKDGIEKEEIYPLEAKVISKKDYQQMKKNKEVKVQEIMLIAAEEKEKARNQIINGNFDEARNILKNATNSLKEYNIKDPRLLDAIKQSEENINQSEQNNSQDFSKILRYQAYSTTRGN